ncbi:MAG: NUDIX hydrolase [Candidatus Pacearchaeota archaeon]|nr:NUDIX hydrolase [Candidatus Pacearchaeota archaeon]
MVVEEIIASGPIIINEGKLLVDKDDKDDFYKLPGGRLKENESLDETCIREAWEEVNADIIIIKKLSTLILNRNPTTHKKMRIELHHYLADLNNLNEIKPVHPIKEIKWLDIKEIKRGKYNVAPNIKFLVEKGEIK